MPNVLAAACVLLDDELGLTDWPAFRSTATRRRGTTPSAVRAALPPTSGAMRLNPVTLPPGRPSWQRARSQRIASGRHDDRNRRVACFAASASGVRLPTMTSTLRRRVRCKPRQTINRYPPSGTRSRGSALRPCPAPRNPRRNAAMQPSVLVAGACRYPIPCICSACCAPAASGHGAAAPPSSVMNSRRSHSITSSAAASSAGGTSRPSAFAVLRLMTSFVLGRRLHRKVGGLGAAQDAVDIGRRLPKHVDVVGAVGHETTIRDKSTERVDRRQAVPGRERDNEIAMQEGGGIRRQDQAAIRLARKRLDGALDVGGCLDAAGHKLERERRRHGLTRRRK